VTAALGIDVGLSGVRAAVVDAEGALLASSRAELVRCRSWGQTPRSACDTPAGEPPRVAAGRAEADPNEWLRGALSAGAAAVAKAGVAIETIAVSALGPAPVLVTHAGEAVSPALLFGLDRRAEEQRARLGVTHDHALPKLLW
jgi:xylulokinase